MRTRDRKRRKVADVDERDEAYFSAMKAQPLPCANRIDASYGRLPATLRPPGEDYVLTNGILMAQFASPNGKALADAVELISTPVEGEGGEKTRLVDGVDLNCVSLPTYDCLHSAALIPSFRDVLNLGHLQVVSRTNSSRCIDFDLEANQASGADYSVNRRSWRTWSERSKTGWAGITISA